MPWFLAVTAQFRPEQSYRQRLAQSVVHVRRHFFIGDVRVHRQGAPPLSGSADAVAVDSASSTAGERDRASQDAVVIADRKSGTVGHKKLFR